jgi:hypothetical protein
MEMTAVEIIAALATLIATGAGVFYLRGWRIELKIFRVEN